MSLISALVDIGLQSLHPQVHGSTRCLLSVKLMYVGYRRELYRILTNESGSVNRSMLASWSDGVCHQAEQSQQWFRASKPNHYIKLPSNTRQAVTTISSWTIRNLITLKGLPAPSIGSPYLDSVRDIRLLGGPCTEERVLLTMPSNGWCEFEIWS